MTSNKFFSPSLSLISIEKLISIELDNRKQAQAFDGLREAQRFFCDFLPIATEFVYEYNSIRHELYELIGAKSRNADSVASVDDRLVSIHNKGVGFVARWASDYFIKPHQFTKPRENVTVTIRYFGKNASGDYVAPVIQSVGPRRVESRIQVALDASLAEFKKSKRPNHMSKDEGPSEKRTGAYICNNLVDWAMQSRFFHPSLHEGNHRSLALLQKAYHSPYNRLFRNRSKRIAPKVIDQWKACWNESDEYITSIASFPITLANNSVPKKLADALTADGKSFDSHEVFGVIVLETPSPFAFNVGDVLMGRIWADALFTFAGAANHYYELSKLRKQLGEPIVSLTT